MQGKQTRAISSNDDSRYSIHNFKVGDPCYALHFGPNQPKIRDGFQPWSSNELALVLFKFGQFPKVASGDVTLINFDHDFLQPKMINLARTTPFNDAPETSTQDEPESSVHVSTNTLAHSPVYGPSNPRLSARARKQRTFYGCALTNY